VETVPVKTLDQIYKRFVDPSDKVFLKVDAQGYEPNILTGARKLIDCCAAIQLEMALFSSYQCQKLLPEMMELMSDRGFALVHLERGFWDAFTGYLIEVDGIFLRTDKLDARFARHRVLDELSGSIGPVTTDH
jgi:hypothetical protein